MHDGFDPTTIIFAAIALFVIWKLRSVLGTRVDIEKRPPADAAERVQAKPLGNVIPLPGAPQRQTAGQGILEKFAPTDQARKGLVEIASADRSFDVARFVEGAKAAYGMIVAAFASGDRATLSTLVSPDVYRNFTSEIEKRESAGETSETKVDSVESAEVASAVLTGVTAQITLKLETKLTTCTRDRAGSVVTGDPDLLVTTVDMWTFARDIGSSDPTWRLVAAESAAV